MTEKELVDLIAKHSAELKAMKEPKPPRQTRIHIQVGERFASGCTCPITYMGYTGELVQLHREGCVMKDGIYRL